MIFLHGHQLKDFLRGRRPEQAHRGEERLESPDLIYMGHYHRLGILAIPGCQSVVCLGGSLTFGAYMNLKQYYPEILSEIGNPTIVGDDEGRIRLDILRQEIDLDRFREDSRQVASNPVSIASRVESTRMQFRRGFKIILPGNHDPIDEIYVHQSITNRIDESTPLGPESTAFGDYADFEQVEMKTARRQFLSMLDEEGYVPLSEVRQSKKS